MISIRYQIIRANSRFRAGMRTGLTAILIACMNLLPSCVLAGGGPENVLVVVNGDSPVSLQVANAYVEMREIPQEHVLWLYDIPYPDSISIDTFRTRIWEPIRDFITQNQLDDEIDIITYSADFPYAVNFSATLKANKLPKLVTFNKSFTNAKTIEELVVAYFYAYLVMEYLEDTQGLEKIQEHLFAYKTGKKTPAADRAQRRTPPASPL